MFLCYFSFYLSDRKSTKTRKTYFCKLNEIVFNTSTDPKMAIVISDMSIKNQVTTPIAHIHVHNSSIIKTIYHTINIISTEAELFAIRCGLNQAIQLSNIEHIIVITDSIHVAKNIFHSSIYPY